MEFDSSLSTNRSFEGNVSVSEHKEINAFPNENPFFKIFKLFCYSLVFLIGVVGNVLVFRIVTKRRKLRTVSNMFICNLAAADIAVLTVNLPFRLAYQENSYVWPFGAFLCKIIPMLMYLFITASSATLFLMTLDKHRAIVYPLRRRFSIKRTKIAIVCIWVFSALVTLPFNFALHVVIKDGKPVCTDIWPNVDFERFYFVCLFVVQFVIPMTIITSCYISICAHLNSGAPTFDRLYSVLRQRTDRIKKVIKMLVVIAAVYALFTLPYHVTWLFSLFGYPNSVAKKLTVLLVIATSAAHPIIYGTLNKEFGRGFGAYTKCCGQKIRNTNRKSVAEKTNRQATRPPTFNTTRNANHTENGTQGKQRVKIEKFEAEIIENVTVVNEMVSCM